MGINHTSFLPQCSCELERLAYSSAMHNKFCPLCNRVISEERRKKVQAIYRKHDSLNDSMFRRGKGGGGAASNMFSFSVQSLPSGVNLGRSKMKRESLPNPFLSSSLSSSSPSRRPQLYREEEEHVNIPFSSNSLKLLNDNNHNNNDRNSFDKVEHFSPLTRKLKSNSNKNIALFSNGGKLPDKSVLRYKRNTLPITAATITTTTTTTTETSSPSLLAVPTSTIIDSEPLPKIVINLGGAFYNHGSRQLPIYVIPPQEPPTASPKIAKSIHELKSHKQEERKMKRQGRYAAYGGGLALR